MKKYLVESRRSTEELFDNYVYDYIYAEDESEAIRLYKEAVVDISLGEMTFSDMRAWEFQAKEV